VLDRALHQLERDLLCPVGAVGEEVVDHSDVEPRRFGADRVPVAAPLAAHGGHHVSTHGGFLPVRGTGGGRADGSWPMRARDSAGSITSSISNTDAMLSALPCS